MHNPPSKDRLKTNQKIDGLFQDIGETNPLYMHFTDFKLLDVPMQAHLICQRGVYLSEREVDDCLVVLYGIHDYYVEVYYHLYDNEIVKFITFHSTQLLEPYLSKINIAQLCEI